VAAILAARVDACESAKRLQGREDFENAHTRTRIHMMHACAVYSRVWCVVRAGAGAANLSLHPPAACMHMRAHDAIAIDGWM